MSKRKASKRKHGKTGSRKKARASKKKSSKSRQVKRKPQAITGGVKPKAQFFRKKPLQPQKPDENIFKGKSEEEIMQELRKRIISGEYRRAGKKKPVSPKFRISKKIRLPRFSFEKKKKTEPKPAIKPLLSKAETETTQKHKGLRQKSLKPKKPVFSLTGPLFPWRQRKKTPKSIKELSLETRKPEKTPEKPKPVLKPKPQKAILKTQELPAADKLRAVKKQAMPIKHRQPPVKTPTQIPKEKELRQKIITSSKPAARAPALNLGPKPVYPESEALFSPQPVEHSNRIVYFTVGLLLALMVVAGIFVAYLLLFPSHPLPADTNSLKEKPMPENMAQALSGSRNQAVQPINEPGSGEVPPALIAQAGETSEKFKTLPGMLEVSLEVTRNEGAAIEKISFLKQGRVSVTPAGDYSVQLLDKDNRLLYKLPFNAVFLIMSDPPTVIDKIKFVFVLPAKDGAVKVAVGKGNRVLAEKEIK